VLRAFLKRHGGDESNPVRLKAAIAAFDLAAPEADALLRRMGEAGSHYTTECWLRAAGWIQLDDSDQGNVRCFTTPSPPS
jgi:hypothetical protein